MNVSIYVTFAEETLFVFYEDVLILGNPLGNVEIRTTFLGENCFEVSTAWGRKIVHIATKAHFQLSNIQISLNIESHNIQHSIKCLYT